MEQVVKIVTRTGTVNVDGRLAQAIADLLALESAINSKFNGKIIVNFAGASEVKTSFEVVSSN